ncbi:MAG: hypothetical protein Roseis2KO_00980 [Roseivirga sp.]
MVEQLLETSTLISSFSVIIPLVIAVTRFKQLSRAQRLLTYLLAISLIVEIIANLLWFQQKRNLVVYNTFAIVHFNFILLIYLNQLGSSWTKPLKVLIVLFNAFFLVDTLLLKKLTDFGYYFNSNITTSASLIFIFLALKYFHKLLKEIKYQKLEKNPLFWISTGLTLYYSGTLILFLLGNQVNQDEAATLYYEIALAAWGLNSLFNLLLNTTYSIALWVKPAK